MPTQSSQPIEQSVAPPEGDRDLITLLSTRLIGQPTALEAIIPSLQLHRSGLAPDGRPVGVFLLLGPTGTGKTRTVEALADVLHGDAKKMLRIDCGEFQGDHEVAKLIGAPPGYVGHGESKPRLTQGSLAEVTSPGSDLALVLFDEIEKAAPTLIQLLLGILDRATLHLGDGTEVDFNDTLVFLTSNLGARDMLHEIRPAMGFESSGPRDARELRGRLERVGLQAVKKFFSPEFVNRIDAIVTYRPLDPASVVAIFDQHVIELQRHVHSRLGDRSFDIEMSPAARYFMIDRGTSLEYGARELKRVMHRHLMQPLAAQVANGKIPPGSQVLVELDEEGEGLVLTPREGVERPVASVRTVLTVDDNAELLDWMEKTLGSAGYTVVSATSVEMALARARESEPDGAVIEYILPDGDGANLAARLSSEFPGIRIVLVSGMDLDEEDLVICRRHAVRLVRKPFLADELLTTLRTMGLSESRTGESARSAQAGG